MEVVSTDGTWYVQRGKDEDSDVEPIPCKSQEVAEKLAAAIETGGRYRFTVDATLGVKEASQVVDVEAV